MTEKFVIGDYSFDTFHEYREAQEDVKKIDLINKELDIHDPEVAVRLYNKIRDGEIVFRSPIGKQFFDHISDVVADGSVGLLEDKAVVDEAEHVAKRQRGLGRVIIAVAVLAFAYLGYVEIRDWYETRQLAELQGHVQDHQDLLTPENTEGGIWGDTVLNQQGNGGDGTAAEEAAPGDGAGETAEVSSDAASTEEGGSASGESGEITETTLASKWDHTAQDPAALTVLPEYAELFQKNPDFAGWIMVDDTDINYPVMQTNDNEYYLKRDFYGKDDSNGTLFIDYRADLLNPTTNTIIYGHNMKSGKMFGSLDNFLNEAYYNSHKTVRFDTRYERRVYEIVAVCLSKVEYQDENTYRYYNFIHAATEDEFHAFYENLQSLSVYGTGIDLASDDQILTLSTCNNYVEDGRLFVVAKRIS